MKQKSTLFFIFFISGASLIAQVPGTLSYQGLLTDATGNPVNGSHTVLFNFYTVSTGGTAAFNRGPLSVTTFQGLFTVILGNGQGSNNAGLPSLGSTQYYIGIVADGGTELTPRVALTAVPYAFTASSLDASATVQGSQITGNNLDGAQLKNTISTATIPAANVTGTLAGSQVGTGVSASNITTGALNGTLVGSGISGANITIGTIGNAQLATGIDATKVSLNSLAIANGGTGATAASGARANLGLAIGADVEAWDADLDDLADGSLTGSKVGTGISATNITTGTRQLRFCPTSRVEYL